MREKVEEIANSKKISVAGYHEISE